MTRSSVKVAMAAVAAHPSTPWIRILVGVPAFAVSLYLLVVERDSDKVHLFTHVGVGVVGILLLPTIFEALVERATKGMELYRAWKAIGKGPTP